MRWDARDTRCLEKPRHKPLHVRHRHRIPSRVIAKVSQKRRAPLHRLLTVANCSPKKRHGADPRALPMRTATESWGSRGSPLSPTFEGAVCPPRTSLYLSPWLLPPALPAAVVAGVCAKSPRVSPGAICTETRVRSATRGVGGYAAKQRRYSDHSSRVYCPIRS
ncbi:hypothetical protein CGC21_30235 [Leishmania donovani]|uniref:Uncharacterized protein n=1 Tax=Leishmania donovani TaxID=5661 RepID=A0A504XD08_LEIDO|nr:hypothetical protein CGC21_30235 [Leishmania donovani]